MITSSGAIMPRSPWLASLGCTKKAGVPVDARVAAILRPTWPDLPMPVTITRPRAWRISSTAAMKACPSPSPIAAASALMPPASVSSVRSAEAISASDGAAVCLRSFDGFRFRHFDLATLNSATWVQRFGDGGAGDGPDPRAVAIARNAAARDWQRPVNHIRFISINQVFGERCRAFRRAGGAPVRIRSTRRSKTRVLGASGKHHARCAARTRGLEVPRRRLTPPLVGLLRRCADGGARADRRRRPRPSSPTRPIPPCWRLRSTAIRAPRRCSARRGRWSPTPPRRAGRRRISATSPGSEPAPPASIPAMRGRRSVAAAAAAEHGGAGIGRQRPGRPRGQAADRPAAADAARRRRRPRRAIGDARLQQNQNRTRHGAPAPMRSPAPAVAVLAPAPAVGTAGARSTLAVPRTLIRRPVVDEKPFDPVGIAAGSFRLRPAIEISGGYDTNPAQNHHRRRRLELRHRGAGAAGQLELVAPRAHRQSARQLHLLWGGAQPRPPGLRRQDQRPHRRHQPHPHRSRKPRSWSRPTIRAARTSRPASPGCRSPPMSAAASVSASASTGSMSPSRAGSTAPPIRTRSSPTAPSPATTTATSINTARNCASATN